MSKWEELQLRDILRAEAVKQLEERLQTVDLSTDYFAMGAALAQASTCSMQGALVESVSDRCEW